MSWNPNAIAGLELITSSEPWFGYRDSAIWLGGSGTFAYDDTAWGQVPDGLCKRLATCAVDPDPIPDGTWYSGEFVQIQLFAVNELGVHYEVSSVGRPPPDGGTVSAFHASMAGFGAVQLANDTDGVISDSPDGGSPYLLRPTTLTWPGQDTANTANRTLWKYNEIGVVSFGLHVASISVLIQPTFQLYGWKIIAGPAPPSVPTTVTPGTSQTGHVRNG